MNGVGLNALLLVLCAVCLGLVSATLLKEASLHEAISWVKLFGFLALVALVNGARFLVWGLVHKRYPLSKSYPLSSMFFPLLLLLSYMYGESVQLKEVLGTLLITIGVVVLTMRD